MALSHPIENQLENQAPNVMRTHWSQQSQNWTWRFSLLAFLLGSALFRYHFFCRALCILINSLSFWHLLFVGLIFWFAAFDSLIRGIMKTFFQILENIWFICNLICDIYYYKMEIHCTARQRLHCSVNVFVVNMNACYDVALTWAFVIWNHCLRVFPHFFPHFNSSCVLQKKLYQGEKVNKLLFCFG